jgi:hypothetical protein
MLENLKENETVVKGVNVFLKAVIYGAVIIGGMLLLNKLIGFWFDLEIGFGL